MHLKDIHESLAEEKRKRNIVGHFSPRRKKSRTTYFLRDRRSESHIVLIVETFADPPRVHPYLPFFFLFGLPLFGPVFAIFLLFSFSTVRNRPRRNQTTERAFPRRGNFVYSKLGQLVDRGFNVGDFCEIWKEMEEGVCALGWLCFVIPFGGRLWCSWWSNFVTIGWKSCILEIIDMLFNLLFIWKLNFICAHHKYY